MALLIGHRTNIFTLPHSIAFPVPTNDCELMVVELLLVQWPGKHVSGLIVHVDGVESDFASFDIVLEVVEFDIDVLSSGSHLWDLCNFKGATVVLKDSAIYHWLGGDHVTALSLQLFHKLHCRTVMQSTVDRPMNLLSVELSAISVWSCDAQRIGQLAYMMM